MYEGDNLQGRIQDFFLGGGALVSCSTSTPINHIVFFLQNTSCIRKLRVISGGGQGAHPLHPPPRSALDLANRLKSLPKTLVTALKTGRKESHFYSLPFRPAEANIY